MKAFVTGSTGLLGSNLIHLLAAQGHQVRALARSKQKADQILAGTGAEVVIGDMEDIGDFAPQMAGCDVLFHTAAYFREYFGPGDHWAKLEAINVKGTIRLLEEAERQGVKKVIYVSSSGVIGSTPDGSPGDETTPPDRQLDQSLYFKSKVVAELAIADWLKTHPLPVVLILPGAIFGPGDSGPTGAGQVILDFLNGKLPAVPPGGFSTVDARDAAQAMIDAVERGRSGERYIVSGRYYSLAEILKILEKVSGVPAPKMPLPYPAALAFAWFSEQRARLTGKEPVATVNAIRTLGLRRDVKADKAERELGFSARPFEETLHDAVNWFRQQEKIVITPIKVEASGQTRRAL